MDKVYHIYLGDKCIFANIKEEEFKVTWSTLHGIVGLMKTEYSAEDLSYEELELNKYEMRCASY